MSITIISSNSTGVVTYKGDRWWAENGLIHMENKDTGEYKTMSIKTALARMKGLSEMVGNFRTGKGYHRADELQAVMTYLEDMIGVCQQAQRQGDPTDVKAFKQTYEEAKARAKSRMVVIPGMNSRF